MGIPASVGRFLISTKTESGSIDRVVSDDNSVRFQNDCLELRVFTPQNMTTVSEGHLLLLKRKVSRILDWTWASCGYVSKDILYRKLVGAIKTANSQSVEKLLKTVENVNARGSDGLTLLHVACVIGDTNIISKLLEAGAYVNARSRDSNGSIPMHILCASNRLKEKSMQTLIRVGAYVHPTDYNGSTALHILCASNRVSKGRIKILLDAKVDVNAKDRNGSTALHILCASNRASKNRIKVLLEAKVDVNAKDGNGSTALHILCDSDRDSDINKSDMIRGLINCGAEMNHINDSDLSALDYAILAYDCKAAHELLSLGADPNVKKCLALAVVNTDVDMVEDLFKQGASIKGAIISQDSGTGLLQTVVNTKREEELFRMLDALFFQMCTNGADIDESTKEQEVEKALVAAVINGNVEVIEWFFREQLSEAGLLDKGLIDRARDAHGAPLLNLAVSHKQDLALSALLKLNAFPDVKDKSGRTPLNHALEQGLEENNLTQLAMACCLLKEGAGFSNLGDDFRRGLVRKVNDKVPLLLKVIPDINTVPVENKDLWYIYKQVVRWDRGNS